MADVADAQLGAVVEDAHGARWLHGVRVLIPEYLWRRRAFRLAVEDDGISCGVVDGCGMVEAFDWS